MPVQTLVWDGAQWLGSGATTAPTGLPPSPWVYQTVTIGAPPPTSGLAVGRTAPISVAQWNADETTYGRLGIRRSFSPGFPSTPPSGGTASGMTDDYGKRMTWHSVKGDWPTAAAGGLDATMTSFLNAVPADHSLMLTFAHEPENDFPSDQAVARSAEWRAAQSRLYDVVKAVRPQTLFGVVLMGWTFNPSSGRTVAHWTPPPGKADFYGVDDYNPYQFPAAGNGTTWNVQPSTQMQTYVAWCAANGVPGAIGENATAEHLSDPNRKAQYLQDIIDYANANGFLAYCYFDAFKPGDTSESMVLNSSAISMAKWTALVAANQFGVK